ncbi:MAG TPA: hypothetical protein DCQ97_10555 [Chitinophagaceae bacterium]|nr:hypothetical protein [Chitinophagaceae bacterium]
MWKKRWIILKTQPGRAFADFSPPEANFFEKKSWKYQQKNPPPGFTAFSVFCSCKPKNHL